MIEMLIVWVLGIISAFAVAVTLIKEYFGLKSIHRNWSRLMNMERRIRDLENAFRDLDYDTKGIDISNLDLDSILDQLGLDKSILENPIVRSFISKMGKNLIKQQQKEPEIKFEE